MFRELVESEYGDSEEKLADLEIEYIKKQKIGTNVIFGNFHWLILENDGDKVLLVKSEPINGLAYNEGDEATTWSECTLREYLNGSFLDGTFSLNMQKKILDTNIKVENNSTYGTKAGTEQYEEILSNYLRDWWLIGPGNSENTAQYVSYGKVMDYGYIVTDTNIHIRPALWVSIK